ncbi:hypothetical protein Bca4012_042258 [Brassica carinata]
MCVEQVVGVYVHHAVITLMNALWSCEVCNELVIGGDEISRSCADCDHVSLSLYQSLSLSVCLAINSNYCRPKSRVEIAYAKQVVGLCVRQATMMLRIVLACVAGTASSRRARGSIRRSTSPRQFMTEQQEAVEECRIVVSGTEIPKPQIESRDVVIHILHFDEKLRYKTVSGVM